MKSLSRLGTAVVPVVLPFLVTSQAIHGYLDAGTGSIVLQAVIGGLLAGLVAIKLFWNQIKAFFSRIVRRTKKPEDHGETKQ